MIHLIKQETGLFTTLWLILTMFSIGTVLPASIMFLPISLGLLFWVHTKYTPKDIIET